MDFPNYFADAELDYKDADIVIFGIPYDKTSSFRQGADKAPYELRQSSWNFETFNIRTGLDIKDIRFHDYGDLTVKNDKPEIMVKKVKDFTTKLLDDKKFPIAIGGEHSITPGILQSFPKDTAVICLDAHMDYRDSYENERFNHACVIKRITDYLPVENIAVIGLRSAEKEEYYEAKKQGLFFADSFDIKKNGIKNILEKTRKHFKNKKIYLTFDIDVLDPCFAPGTSTPEPFGLSPFDIVECIDFFSPNLVGFDIVEVCPPYDHGETALIAAKFIRYIIEIIGKKYI